MTKGLTLNLSEFSRRALERVALRGNGSTSSAVRMASLYYLSDRDSQRPVWRVPRFATGGEPGHSLTIELDDATWRALSDEAEEQGVTTEVLAVHAVFYFLADLDSGRLVGLLEEALENTDE
jgi:predicted DNA-binding ribbon-helix-helix protein